MDPASNKTSPVLFDDTAFPRTNVMQYSGNLERFIEVIVADNIFPTVYSLHGCGFLPQPPQQRMLS